jgi:hypothetical protein
MGKGEMGTPRVGKPRRLPHEVRTPLVVFCISCCIYLFLSALWPEIMFFALTEEGASSLQIFVQCKIHLGLFYYQIFRCYIF